jgi:hypothetical protein
MTTRIAINGLSWRGRALPRQTVTSKDLALVRQVAGATVARQDEAVPPRSQR